jgi:hypothetical protein
MPNNPEDESSVSESSATSIETLDLEISIPLEIVKNELKVIKQTPDYTGIYKSHLKLFLKFKDLLTMLASYDYMMTKGLTFGDIISDFMENIDDEIKEVEAYKVFSEKAIDILNYSVAKIKTYYENLEQV